MITAQQVDRNYKGIIAAQQASTQHSSHHCSTTGIIAAQQPSLQHSTARQGSHFAVLLQIKQPLCVWLTTLHKAYLLTLSCDTSVSLPHCQLSHCPTASCLTATLPAASLPAVSLPAVSLPHCQLSHCLTASCLTASCLTASLLAV